ncbi:MAG: GNAT family N-acetyltransferase [Chthoniobacterales bacterium]|nr:GNAT family N-acetyltransferase [Chthoniobacterales bacterium]
MSEQATPRVKVRPARAHELLELRHRVLRAGFGREEASFDGDDDPRTRHFVAVDHDDAVVGCASIMPDSYGGKPSWRLRGMAIEEGWRSRGVGAELLRVIDAFVASDSSLAAPQLWCNARTPAVEFYKRNGWVVVSDEFVIETAGPHFKMTRTVPSIGRSKADEAHG